MNTLMKLLGRQPAECRRVAEVLQQVLDGEIDDLTAAEVQAHLDECRNCGLEAEAYRDLKASLARHREPDVAAVARLRAFADGLAEGGGAA